MEEDGGMRENASEDEDAVCVVEERERYLRRDSRVMEKERERSSFV